LRKRRTDELEVQIDALVARFTDELRALIKAARRAA
jgi:hypothetical protein